MNILFVVRTSLHLYPPCINQINYLRDLGHDVLVICGNCDINTKQLLEKRDVKIIDLALKRSSLRVIGKFQSYINYYLKCRKLLSEKFVSGDIVWFGTADSCFALGNRYNQFPYVLNVLELYDNNRLYKYGVKRVINDASAVVVCNRTRLDIMNLWWTIEKKPFVMPNKPYSLPSRNSEGSIKETKDIIKKIREKKVFLYQGIISSDRSLTLLAEALNKLDDEDIYLGLMGKELTNSVDYLKGVYPRTMYLGYIPAPYHLEVTSNAFAGIAYYQGNSLNNLFCAPNKIYEYSGLGLPILCNDIPGLRETVDYYHAGECVDFGNQDELISAIKNIANDNNRCSYNTQALFDSVDNKDTIQKILDSLRFCTE